LAADLAKAKSVFGVTAFRPGQRELIAACQSSKSFAAQNPPEAQFAAQPGGDTKRMSELIKDDV